MAKRRRNPEQSGPEYAMAVLNLFEETPDGAVVEADIHGRRVVAHVDDAADLSKFRKSDLVLLAKEAPAGEWQFVPDRELSGLAESVIESMANASAAQAWSTPSDNDKDQFDKVHIVAEFGDWMAVNGDLVLPDQKQPEVPEGYQFFRRGGRAPTVEEEISLESVARALDDQLGLKGRGTKYIHKGLLEESRGKEFVYTSVSGDTEFYAKPKADKAKNPPCRENPGVNLKPPFEITARLLPGLKVGDSYISAKFAGLTEDRRARVRCYIDTPKWTHTDANLTSGVGGASLQEMFVSLLSFLSAAAESYKYRMRTGGSGENESLFPKKVNEWAYQHDDELGMLREQIEKTPDLIADAGNNPSSSRRWPRTIKELGKFLNSKFYYEGADGLVGIPYLDKVNWYRLTLGGYSLAGATGIPGDVQPRRIEEAQRLAANPPEENDDDFNLKQEMAEGYVIGDARGGGYAVVRESKYRNTFESWDEALRFIIRDMSLQKHRPSVFYVNDHGNVDLLALKPKTGRGVSLEVESKIVRSWV